jgi:hypothetical protein
MSVGFTVVVSCVRAAGLVVELGLALELGVALEEGVGVADALLAGAGGAGATTWLDSFGSLQGAVAGVLLASPLYDATQR